MRTRTKLATGGGVQAIGKKPAEWRAERGHGREGGTPPPPPLPCTPRSLLGARHTVDSPSGATGKKTVVGAGKTAPARPPPQALAANRHNTLRRWCSPRSACAPPRSCFHPENRFLPDRRSSACHPECRGAGKGGQGGEGGRGRRHRVRAARPCPLAQCVSVCARKGAGSHRLRGRGDEAAVPPHEKGRLLEARVAASPSALPPPITWVMR